MPKNFLKEFTIITYILCLLFSIAFYDIVFLGKTFKVTTANAQALISGVYGQKTNKPAFIPTNGTDAPVMEEPIWEFLKNNIRKGTLPLWNPHQACGYPLIAMLEIGLFYPLHLILLLLPNIYAWDILISIRIILGGLLTYFFMRSIKCKPLPALTSAISFMFMGPLLLLQYWTANVDILLPLFLIVIERFIQKPNLIKTGFLGSVIALTIFAGHPEHIFLVNAYAGCYFAFRLISLRKKVKWTFALSHYLIGYLLGLGISAIVLFPFIQNFLGEFWTGHPERVGLLMEEQRERFITLALPHFFQKEAVTYTWQFAGWWGGYLGIFPLAFYFMSLFNKQKNARNYFFAAAAGILIAKQYGLFFVNWLGYLPLFSKCRYAIHTPTLAAFSVAVSAGFGLRSIICLANNYRKGLIFSSFLILLIIGNLFFIRNSEHLETSIQASLFALILLFCFQVFLWLRDKKLLSPPLIGLLLIACLFVELFSYIHREHPKRFDSFPRVPYLEKLQSSPDPIRSYGYFWAFYPNTGTGFGVDDLGFFMGLVPKRFVEFTNNLIQPNHFRKDLRPPALRVIPLTNCKSILDLLNVHYIISTKDSTMINIFKSYVPFKQYSNAVYRNEVNVFNRKDAFPRAFITHRVIFQTDPQKTFLILKNLESQLRDVAVIKSPFIPQIFALLSKAPIKDSSQAKIIHYSANKVIIEAIMQNPGFLVLSDAFHPDWRATVNGKKTRIFETDYMLRSVFLPSGRCHIEFEFKPFSFYLGMLISCLTLILTAGFIFSGLLAQPKNNSQQ